MQYPQDMPIEQVMFAGFDIETTGVSPRHDRIIEMGIARARLGESPEIVETLVQPSVAIHPASQRVHGITQDMLSDAPPFYKVAMDYLERLEGTVLVGHNVLEFDLKFFNLELVREGFRPVFLPGIDTKSLARRLIPDLRRTSLASVAEMLGIRADVVHRAGSDAYLGLRILFALLPGLMRDGINTLGHLVEQGYVRWPARGELGQALLSRFVEQGFLEIEVRLDGRGARRIPVLPVTLTGHRWDFFDEREEKLFSVAPQDILAFQ